MSEKKTFLPEQWENAPSNSNAAKNASQQMTPYNNIGGECTYDKVDRVIGLIEESGVDITEGYDAWVKVGFALASEFKESGRDFFHRVSKVNAKYNHAETDKQYDKCLASTGSGVTIGTFFQMAKDRGVDISNAKPDVPPTEIKNAHIGNMDFWKNGDSDKAPQPQSANIHKAKNPNVHLCEIGGKWIYDEEELPHFPSFVYETLPPFLKEVVDNCISPDDRDMILMGAMTCLSITLHNVVGEYNHDDWGPMLYFFVMADAGMGKGSLNYCRQLVAPIHKELREISDQQIREYKAEKRQAKQDGNTFSGEEPHRRTLFIPTNSSAASVIEQLDYNDGIGLIFDTECDTLTAVLKSEFGDYTTIIRKAYHHEPIDIKRRKENEDRLVEHPMLAICLSGTPEQLYTLTPKAEDGTFSRITCYHIPFKMDFRDVLSESSFSEGKHSSSLRDVYYQLGLRYKRMRETFFRGGNYRVVIPQDLCEEFNQHYRLVNKEAVEDISNDMQGVVRRLAFAVFRMMMVLTAIRFMDETPNPSALAQKDVRTILRCKEEDFRIAMALGDTLIYHTVYCYSHLPKTDVATTIGGKILTKKDKMEMLYAALPDSFSRPQYVAVSTDLGFSPSTTSKWINTFILQGRLERCEHNDYRKLTPNSSEAS